MATGIPDELAFELSNHQGPIRAVRFNSKYLSETDSDCSTCCWSHCQEMVTIA